MPRSLRTSITGSQQAKAALKRCEYQSQAVFADSLGYSRATVSKFFNGGPVDRAVFEAICDRLGLDWQIVSDQSIYIERGIEDKVSQAITQNGALLRIVGLKQTGKTWLLEKIIIPKAQRQNYATVSLSFKGVNESYLQDMEKLLQWFCNKIGKELDLDLKLEDYWDKYNSPNGNASDYLEKVLEKLKGSKKPLVIALDDFDAVLDNIKIANDFCKLLRFWHDEPNRNNRNSSLWKQLRLVILHSTEIYAGLDINSSPLSGVGEHFKLEDFNKIQIKKFIQQYDLDWSDADLDKLINLVGEHPHLIDQACQEYNRQEVTLDELLQQAITESGIYANHLREISGVFANNPHLKAAFKEVIEAQGKVKLNPNDAFKLERLGVIKLEGNLSILRCTLYHNYFETRL